MKALSLTQPWATLIALGVKRVETRGWFTHYRGPLAIHATGKCVAGPIGDFEVEKDNPRGSSPAYLIRGSGLRPYRIPLGAIVATCNLVDVVATDGAIIGADADGVLTWFEDEHASIRAAVAGWHPWGWRGDTPLGPARNKHYAICERQRPYGDYGPGRAAWLLADIEPIRQPIPVRGHQGLWNWTDPR